MRNLGKNPTEEQLAEMIADIDADNNGSIGLAEFCTLFAQAGGDEPEEPLQQPAPSQASQPGSPPKSPKKQSASNTAAAATARRLKSVGCTPLMPGEVDLVYQRCTAVGLQSRAKDFNTGKEISEGAQEAVADIAEMLAEGFGRDAKEEEKSSGGQMTVKLFVSGLIRLAWR